MTGGVITFEEWLKTQPYTPCVDYFYAKAAWDHQQQEIETLKAENERLRAALLHRKWYYKCGECGEFTGDGMDHAESCRHYDVEARAEALEGE